MGGTAPRTVRYGNPPDQPWRSDCLQPVQIVASDSKVRVAMVALNLTPKSLKHCFLFYTNPLCASLVLPIPGRKSLEPVAAENSNFTLNRVRTRTLQNGFCTNQKSAGTLLLRNSISHYLRKLRNWITYCTKPCAPTVRTFLQRN